MPDVIASRCESSLPLFDQYMKRAMPQEWQLEPRSGGVFYPENLMGTDALFLHWAVIPLGCKRRGDMKTVLSAVLAIGALVSASAPTLAQHRTWAQFQTTFAQSPTFAQYDAYCLQAEEWGLPGDCRFSTFEACRVTASGIGGACDRNPMSNHYPTPGW